MSSERRGMTMAILLLLLLLGWAVSGMLGKPEPTPPQPRAVFVDSGNPYYFDVFTEVDCAVIEQIRGADLCVDKSRDRHIVYLKTTGHYKKQVQQAIRDLAWYLAPTPTPEPTAELTIEDAGDLHITGDWSLPTLDLSYSVWADAADPNLDAVYVVSGTKTLWEWERDYVK